MDPVPWTPKVFANKVIYQFVQHSFGDDMLIELEDYRVIRAVFQRIGGSWDQLAQGDMVMLGLLQKVINVWGNMPEREREADRLI